MPQILQSVTEFSPYTAKSAHRINNAWFAVEKVALQWAVITLFVSPVSITALLLHVQSGTVGTGQSAY
jgi:hypothetical protein